MGQINHPVSISNLIDKFDIKNFVETGTGDGTSMEIVLKQSKIKNAYGIELDEGRCQSVSERNQDRLEMYCGYSHEQLPQLVEQLNSDPTLFWLDCHFPGSDYDGLPYDSEPDPVKRIPLETELNILKEKRDLSNDIIMIDDLRIYKDGEYENGNWDMRKTIGGEDADFIDQIIGDTHLIIEHCMDQGYIIAFPIGASEEIIRSVIIQ